MCSYRKINPGIFKKGKKNNSHGGSTKNKLYLLRDLKESDRES